MTPVDRLRAQYADLTRLIQRTDDVGNEEWSPEWMSKQSLLMRQAELAHQLSLYEGTAQVEIRLLGGAERAHEIEAQFFGHFLQHLQMAVAAIVQTLMHGGASSRGQLPADVVRAASLTVGAVSPGSFVVHLSGPDREQQLALTGDMAPPPFDEAMDRVLDLFDQTRNAEHTELLETAIAELRSPRAILHISEIAQALARTGTTATVTERSPFSEQPRQAALTAPDAERLQQILSRTRQETERVFLTGVLSGVRWTRGIFDLEVDHAGEVEIVSGRVRSDLRPAVSAAFDRRVRAELERTRTWTGFRDTPTESWLMVGVLEITTD